MWPSEAIRRIDADENRSADTHLHAFPLPPQWGIDLYLKDESVHPTGSLKHRLARSLFLYGLCNGWITERTPVVDRLRRMIGADLTRLLLVALAAHPQRATRL